MIIQYRTVSIFGINAQAYVNPVNCIGISGNGLAFKFKREFPTNFDEYKKACIAGTLHPGGLFVYQLSWLEDYPKTIINFATKAHWRNRSRLEWIRTGMNLLSNTIIQNKIESIAIPMLGCGFGGLDWKSQVRPIVIDTLNTIKEHKCTVSLMID